MRTDSRSAPGPRARRPGAWYSPRSPRPRRCVARPRIPPLATSARCARRRWRPANAARRMLRSRCRRARSRVGRSHRMRARPGAARRACESIGGSPRACPLSAAQTARKQARPRRRRTTGRPSILPKARCSSTRRSPGPEWSRARPRWRRRTARALRASDSGLRVDRRPGSTRSRRGTRDRRCRLR